MATIKAIIVDDEKNSRIVLHNLLSNFCKTVEIAGEASSAEEAYPLILEKKPELVFLDIQMPTGTGFSLLQKFEQVPFEVVFITSYDEYAINAIKFNALDYLLKPVEITELQAAVKKAEDRIGNTLRTDTGMQNLIENLDKELLDQRISFHKNDQVHYVSIRDISHLRSDGNYTNVVTAHQGVYNSSKTLKEYDDYLSVFPGFIRVHRNCLINVRYLKSYSKGEPCVITMDNGDTVEVSRRKKQEVLEALRDVSPKV